MQHYTYFRSSAAYRVRIALNLKGIAAQEHYVHLRKGEQTGADYLKHNPQGLVPALVDDNGTVLGQSLAIIEYLDETRPEPPLLPPDPRGRARVRQLSYVIAADLHPLNNLRVLNYLSDTVGVTQEQRLAWYRHWTETGLAALETLLAGAGTGTYCHGDTPTMADLCLVPQVYNANRFEVEMAPYPTVQRINDACLALDDFAKAAPDVQPDAE
ncbi:MAG: maleylacetoacetate isomerase [Alphaproteobacteria bacterium]